MSEKRFMQSWNMHRGLHYLAIEDKQEKKIYCVEQYIEDVEEVADLLNELAKENEQLRKSEKINMDYAEQIVEENHKLRIAKNHLQRENEQLKKENERKTNEIKLLQKAYSKIPKGIREVWKE